MLVPADLRSLAETVRVHRADDLHAVAKILDQPVPASPARLKAALRLHETMQHVSTSLDCLATSLDCLATLIEKEG